MSRGAGEVQERLIDIIRRDGPDLPLPSLVWAAARDEGVLDGDNLPDESYKRLHASARRLANPSAHGAVVVRTERAATLEELVAWYPDRTKDGTVRRLRRELLPLVEAYLEIGRPKAKSLAESEDYVLRRAAGDALGVQFVDAWRELEDALVVVLPRLDDSARGPAVELLARGRSLAVPGCPIRADVSLVVAIRQVRKAVTGHRSRLVTALARMENVLPARRIEWARLRTVIAAVARIGKRESSGLKEPFKDYLLRARPKTIRALEGHREPRVKPTPWGARSARQFDARLDELILRDSLKEFHLYSIASARR